MGRWAQVLLIVSTGVFVCLCGPLHDGKYDLCFAGILTQAVQTLNSESDENSPAFSCHQSSPAKGMRTLKMCVVVIVKCD